jgi:glycosyltransferase involved in cell wall biosynthesis
MTLRILGKVCVYDAHEHLSTDVLDKPWISRRWKPLFVRLSRVMERALALSSSALIAATPGIAEHFPSAKTVLVQNFPLREELEFFTGARPRLDAAGKRRFVFLGLLNKIRGGFQLVEALRRVERKDIVVTIVGQIAEPDLLHDLQELEATGKLELLGWQPREVALKLVAESAAGLLLYQPVKHHELSLPNKLFEYMALGLPVIASNFKLWSEIVGNADCGWIVDPVDPDEIARALAACAADPVAAVAKGRNGREAIRQRYIWDTEAEKLISLYARLLGPRL